MTKTLQQIPEGRLPVETYHLPMTAAGMIVVVS